MSKLTRDDLLSGLFIHGLPEFNDGIFFFFSFDFFFCISHRAGGLQWLLDSGKVYCILGENVSFRSLGGMIFGENIFGRESRGGSTLLGDFPQELTLQGYELRGDENFPTCQVCTF